MIAADANLHERDSLMDADEHRKDDTNLRARVAICLATNTIVWK